MPSTLSLPGVRLAQTEQPTFGPSYAELLAEVRQNNHDGQQLPAHLHLKTIRRLPLTYIVELHLPYTHFMDDVNNWMYCSLATTVASAACPEHPEEDLRRTHYTLTADNENTARNRIHQSRVHELHVTEVGQGVGFKNDYSIQVGTVARRFIIQFFQSIDGSVCTTCTGTYALDITCKFYNPAPARLKMRSFELQSLTTVRVPASSMIKGFLALRVQRSAGGKANSLRLDQWKGYQILQVTHGQYTGYALWPAFFADKPTQRFVIEVEDDKDYLELEGIVRLSEPPFLGCRLDLKVSHEGRQHPVIHYNHTEPYSDGQLVRREGLEFLDFSRQVSLRPGLNSLRAALWFPLPYNAVDQRGRNQPAWKIQAQLQLHCDIHFKQVKGSEVTVKGPPLRVRSGFEDAATHHDRGQRE